ncbi:hypothetical protein BA6E_106138 [Bacteroidales bacterium 6E]|nr:hypothetical protein BA6E_106138 [Bacteroidales bacterium 6E]
MAVNHHKWQSGISAFIKKPVITIDISVNE